MQIDADGRLRHFLTIEGLSRALLTEILDTAESFTAVGEQMVKKVPLLRGKTIVNLFFEASTRTRTTFELAAKRVDVPHLAVDRHRIEVVQQQQRLLGPVTAGEADEQIYLAGLGVGNIELWFKPSLLQFRLKEGCGFRHFSGRIDGLNPNVLLETLERLALDAIPIGFGGPRRRQTGQRQ